jgi:pyridoxal phosphate enzyme (YggS family)
MRCGSLCAGQHAFGENYIQEAVEKITALRHLPLQWHCIGPIQSNKTRPVAEHFDWVHTVDRLKIAQRLSEQRPAHLAPLQVCIQVNVDGGPTKSGVAPHDALALARQVADLPRLQLRGLMCIPEPAPDFVAACAVFARAEAFLMPLLRRAAAGYPVHGHERRPGSRRGQRQHHGACGQRHLWHR